MSWRAAHVMSLGAVVFGLWSAIIAKADDQQLVEDYLVTRGASGAVVRPITDDYVGRAFPRFSFFGVIFRKYPVAVLCPQTQDLKCSNLFFVKDGRVDFVATIPDLKFLFSAELVPAPSEEAAADAASTWLRFSEELKQDLFYAFSAPEITYVLREDITTVRGHAAVVAGGQGRRAETAPAIGPGQVRRRCRKRTPADHEGAQRRRSDCRVHPLYRSRAEGLRQDG